MLLQKGLSQLWIGQLFSERHHDQADPNADAQGARRKAHHVAWRIPTRKEQVIDRKRSSSSEKEEGGKADVVTIFQHRLEAKHANSSQPCDADGDRGQTGQATVEQSNGSAHLDKPEPVLPDAVQIEVRDEQMPLNAIHEKWHGNMNRQNDGDQRIKAGNAVGVCPEGDRPGKDVGTRQATANERGDDCDNDDTCNQGRCRELRQVSPVRGCPWAFVEPLLMSQRSPGGEEEANRHAASPLHRLDYAAVYQSPASIERARCRSQLGRRSRPHQMAPFTR